MYTQIHMYTLKSHIQLGGFCCKLSLQTSKSQPKPSTDRPKNSKRKPC